MNGRRARERRFEASRRSYEHRGEVKCTASHEDLVGRCPTCRAEK